MTISRYRDVVDLVRGNIFIPAISSFYGITIKMYFLSGEHNPPHVHAVYGDDSAAINFQTDKIVEGYLPPGALQLVLEESTLRKAISYGKLVNGVDVCKYGKQWVVSMDSLIREYGQPK